jgi:membrane protease subunit HflC
MLKYRFTILLVLIVLVLWGQSAFYAVDQAEFAYVTQFGEPVVVLDGASQAGLHVKWPWPIESVDRIDRRLQLFDLPPAEPQTRDLLQRTVDKTLTVDAYVCWRIPETRSADQFYKTVRTPEEARRLLTPRITSRLSAVISAMQMEDIIQAVDQGTSLAMLSSSAVLSFDRMLRSANEQVIDRRMERIRRQILEADTGRADGGESIADMAKRVYGIEIVDIRLRRFNYPEKVRGEIANRIRSERNRKAAEYQSEGNRKYTEIVSNAERQAAKIVYDANIRRREIENQADIEADLIRSRAHEVDPEFYTFLQKLKAYQTMLSETRDVLLLSSKHELFDLLLNPPKPAPQNHK